MALTLCLRYTCAQGHLATCLTLHWKGGSATTRSCWTNPLGPTCRCSNQPRARHSRSRAVRLPGRTARSSSSPSRAATHPPARQPAGTTLLGRRPHGVPDPSVSATPWAWTCARTRMAGPTAARPPATLSFPVGRRLRPRRRHRHFRPTPRLSRLRRRRRRRRRCLLHHRRHPGCPRPVRRLRHHLHLHRRRLRPTSGRPAGSASSVALLPTRVESRCRTTASGAPSATTDGATSTRRWCAASCHTAAASPKRTRTLGRAAVQSGSVTFPATVTRRRSETAGSRTDFVRRGAPTPQTRACRASSSPRFRPIRRQHRHRPRPHCRLLLRLCHHSRRRRRRSPCRRRRRRIPHCRLFHRRPTSGHPAGSASSVALLPTREGSRCRTTASGAPSATMDGAPSTRRWCAASCHTAEASPKRTRTLGRAAVQSGSGTSIATVTRRRSETARLRTGFGRRGAPTPKTRA